MKVAQTARAKTRGERNKMDTGFTHFLPQKLTPLSIVRVSSQPSPHLLPPENCHHSQSSETFQNLNFLFHSENISFPEQPPGNSPTSGQKGESPNLGTPKLALAARMWGWEGEEARRDVDDDDDVDGVEAMAIARGGGWGNTRSSFAATLCQFRQQGGNGPTYLRQRQKQ